eukprot:TRINITY_DN56738_c0_g1_i1.p1 TRINITY_DN56738_c0_g1~~TRINITY_DN56738_c0_g1_i1.p1  ORF type:complete len:180 (-),score=34.20 TRINITY_DN56738_c0_g1_i1:37-576(-)
MASISDHPVSETTIYPAAAPSEAAASTLAAWHRAVEVAIQGGEGNATDVKAALASHVSSSVVFKPPTYFKPWQGRDVFLVLIETVSEVFGKSFRYRREWISPDGRDWCLEFTANINGNEMTGVDLVRLDETGAIEHFEVLARPPKAVKALQTEMGRRVPAKVAALQAAREAAQEKISKL